MITAQEALGLEHAQLTDEERREVHTVCAHIERNIQEKMTFGGPPALDVPYTALTPNAVKALCVELSRYGWNASVNLMSLPPSLRGAEPTPHHWTILLSPTIDEYKAVFTLSSSLLQ